MSQEDVFNAMRMAAMGGPPSEQSQPPAQPQQYAQPPYAQAQQPPYAQPQQYAQPPAAPQPQQYAQPPYAQPPAAPQQYAAPTQQQYAQPPVVATPTPAPAVEAPKRRRSSKRAEADAAETVTAQTPDTDPIEVRMLLACASGGLSAQQASEYLQYLAHLQRSS